MDAVEQPSRQRLGVDVATGLAPLRQVGNDIAQGVDDRSLDGIGHAGPGSRERLGERADDRRVVVVAEVATLVECPPDQLVERSDAGAGE